MAGPITLTLTDDEAAAVAVALVGLIHEEPVGPTTARWQVAATHVAERLRIARDEEERR